MDPSKTLRMARGHVRLVGTVPGFAPDAARVAYAMEAEGPVAVALGIPPEDLEGLQALHDDPSLADELPPLDGPEERFHGLLGRYGKTRIPSPDLETAYRLATEQDLQVAAVDLDDETHTTLYTGHLKVRHLWKRTRLQDKLMKMEFADAEDAYRFAMQWDQVANGMKPLQEVEAAREAAMAQGIRDLVAEHGRVVAVLHVARMPGVVAHLQA